MFNLRRNEPNLGESGRPADDLSHLRPPSSCRSTASSGERAVEGERLCWGSGRVKRHTRMLARAVGLSRVEAQQAPGKPSEPPASRIEAPEANTSISCGG